MEEQREQCSWCGQCFAERAAMEAHSLRHAEPDEPEQQSGRVGEAVLQASGSLQLDKVSLPSQPSQPIQLPQYDEGPMSSLAEELLLAVFSRLDGRTLGLAVPLVCRRWRRVAKDPRAWAGAVLDVKTNTDADNDNCQSYSVDCKLCADGLHGPLEQALRVLRIAPALRRLDLSGVHNCPRDYEVLLSLRRCPAAVREVVLPSEDVTVGLLNPERGLDLMLDLLSRCAPSLRALDVGLLLRSRKVERAVAELKGLRSLALELRHDFKPCGALRGALPRLARLEVRSSPDCACDVSCNLNRRSGRGAASLLADLVGGAAGTLRELVLEPGGVQELIGAGPLPPPVLAEARRCSGLRELHCDVEDLVLLRHLPALRTLGLHMLRRREACAYNYTDEHDPLVDYEDSADEELTDEDSDEEYTYGDKAAMGSAAAALRRMRPLLSLREVHVDVTYHECGGETVAAVRLLEALADAAPAVTSLEVFCMWEAFPLASVLRRLPRLRCARLHWCTAAALDALAALPDLQEVHAKIDLEPPAEWCDRDSDGARQQRERLEAAMAEARARRPAVAWNLSLY